jgi:hypothetical protein
MSRAPSQRNAENEMEPKAPPTITWSTDRSERDAVVMVPVSASRCTSRPFETLRKWTPPYRKRVRMSGSCRPSDVIASTPKGTYQLE